MPTEQTRIVREKSRCGNATTDLTFFSVCTAGIPVPIFFHAPTQMTSTLSPPSPSPAVATGSIPVTPTRFHSDRKTRARQAMISICADSPPNHAHAAAAEEPAVPYVLEVDSPFFQLSRDNVLLAPEPLGGGGGNGGSGGVGNTTARSTARGPGGAGVGGGIAGGRNIRRDLPKKVELLEPAQRGCAGGDDAAGTGAGGGPAAPLPDTNATLVNFFPRTAGAYPCRLLLKRRMKHLVDVRCVDIAATVDAPRNVTALVFRAPAGQKITQEVCDMQEMHVAEHGSHKLRRTVSTRLSRDTNCNYFEGCSVPYEHSGTSQHLRKAVFVLLVCKFFSSP